MKRLKLWQSIHWIATRIPRICLLNVHPNSITAFIAANERCSNKQKCRYKYFMSFTTIFSVLYVRALDISSTSKYRRFYFFECILSVGESSNESALHLSFFIKKSILHTSTYGQRTYHNASCYQALLSALEKAIADVRYEWCSSFALVIFDSLRIISCIWVRSGIHVISS